MKRFLLKTFLKGFVAFIVMLFLIAWQGLNLVSTLYGFGVLDEGQVVRWSTPIHRLRSVPPFKIMAGRITTDEVISFLENAETNAPRVLEPTVNLATNTYVLLTIAIIYIVIRIVGFVRSGGSMGEYLGSLGSLSMRSIIRWSSIIVPIVLFLKLRALGDRLSATVIQLWPVFGVALVIFILFTVFKNNIFGRHRGTATTVLIVVLLCLVLLMGAGLVAPTAVTHAAQGLLENTKAAGQGYVQSLQPDARQVFYLVSAMILLSIVSGLVLKEE